MLEYLNRTQLLLKVRAKLEEEGLDPEGFVVAPSCEPSAEEGGWTILSTLDLRLPPHEQRMVMSVKSDLGRRHRLKI
ncbi:MULTISPECIES: hypothetical protein [unclassified Bradyrhizobium]|uniref:hypothetical protein n=1 Tax=unclassified Bradyrhizobium TaxID=2631580 RepID=UPI0028EB48BF|nr:MULTISPECIES: hypothetical protein [unclassified Bradyrhizobium]